ncbi:MAG: hypothetical protein A3K65_05595 [Euryarchaeota archaeon RBG_16_68_12]|nr:MAG: hypothetical protein A3K65_05595 [Euryarchaeota archaeon RBG_16_68_12]
MTRRARVLSASPLVLVLVLLVLAALSGPASGFPTRTTYGRSIPAPGSGPIAVGDVDGDGRPDVVAAEGSGQLMVFYQTDAGLPSTPVAVQGSVARKILLADMDGNGTTDIVALGNDTTTIYFRDAAGFNGRPVDVPGPGARDLAVGDLNGDGRRDLALVTPASVQVLFQNSSGAWPSSAALNLTMTSGFHGVAVADMNGDGRPDLVIAKPNDMRVYFQGPLGIDLEPNVLTNPGISDGSISLCVRDMNGDGRPDAILGDTNPGARVGNVSVYFQEGTPSNPLFNLSSRVAGALTDVFALGDLNDDGRPDLAAVTYDAPPAAPLAVYVQRLTGGFDPAPTFRLDTGGGLGTPTGIAIGRFSAYPYNYLVARVPRFLLVFEQEDNAPVPIQAVPSDAVFNEGASGAGLIDLRNYFSDDHGMLRFGVAFEERPDDLHATLAADGHHLDFTARPGWVGTARFQVAVTDGILTHPPVLSNVFAVTVNALPVFTSTPAAEVREGAPFLYQVAVSDPYPADDAHAFSLVLAPAGMTIDPHTGLVEWHPAASDVGTHSVTVRVTDAYDGTAEQTFELRVVAAPAPPSTAALIAAGLAAAVGTLGIGTLVSENVKYGLLTIFIPLYSKIKREQVLDHFVRGQIYGYVLANPGEHYNAIKVALGLTNGSLAHHLKTLEREQFLKSKRFGLYRRFYPMNMRIPEDGFFAPNEIQKTIVDIIRTNPGITQKEIALHLGLTPPTVNYHISILREHRAIRVERAGRKTHCFVADAEPTDAPTGPEGGPSSGTPRPGAPRP